MAEKANEIKTEPEEAFTKDAVMHSVRYADRRDALSFLLKDGETYTHTQIETILSDFYGGEN